MFAAIELHLLRSIVQASHLWFHQRLYPTYIPLYPLYPNDCLVLSWFIPYIPIYSHTRSVISYPFKKPSWVLRIFIYVPMMFQHVWWYSFQWFTGWWLSPTPLKNDGVRQLGSLFPRYGKIIHSCSPNICPIYGKIIHSCSKPPTSLYVL